MQALRWGLSPNSGLTVGDPRARDVRLEMKRHATLNEGDVTNLRGQHHGRMFPEPHSFPSYLSHSPWDSESGHRPATSTIPRVSTSPHSYALSSRPSRSPSSLCRSRPDDGDWRTLDVRTRSERGRCSEMSSGLRRWLARRRLCPSLRDPRSWERHSPSHRPRSTLHPTVPFAQTAARCRQKGPGEVLPRLLMVSV